MSVIVDGAELDQQVTNGFRVVVQVAGQPGRQGNVNLPRAANAATTLSLKFPTSLGQPSIVALGLRTLAADIDEQVVCGGWRWQREYDGEVHRCLAFQKRSHDLCR